jgi:Common central domain of tyrosinase/Polyphenol oxidase middle domain
MTIPQNRRTFLAAAGITVASVVTQRLSGQPSAPTQGTRETVAGMDADHPTLVSYRAAIQAMKQLNATDPLSWAFQANMHGALPQDGQNNGWRWCMHGNWWFLPWHRGYVYYFERIIRKMSGNDAFRLPYWPWEKDGQNVLPAPFRDAKYQGQDNPLFDATRVEANTGQPLRPATQSGSFGVDWERALRIDEFTTTFAELSYGGIRKPKTTMPAKPVTSRQHGGMESNAHDMLHDAVGGDTGNMGDPRTAARDPIFWLHHANVDRLWNRWLDIKGHLLPDPADDKDWYDQEFQFFDENGKQVVVSVNRILELAAKEYQYDDDDRRLFAAAPPATKREKAVEPKVVSVGAISPMLALSTKPLTKALAITEETKPKLMNALAAPRSGAAIPFVLLRVEDIKPPKDAHFTFEVFLMKRGEKPSRKSYVGQIAFFGRRGNGDHGHDENEGFTQGFDVTDLIQKLRTANKGVLPELEVSVVPHSTAGLSDTDLAKKNVEIPISNITLKLVTVEK